MKKDLKLYWTLFTSTFLLSAFTFGGGFVIVPLMKKKFVDNLKWIEEEEMLNLVAIAQSSPGAIAVNASILIGYRIAGISGAIISTIGTVMPPLIILTTISFFYKAFRESTIISALLKGMQAGVAAVIVDVVFNLAGTVVKSKQIISVVMMLGAFIATYVYGVNVAYIILICGLTGAITVFRKQKLEKEEFK
ncbi:MAG: chromate transporter [Mobilitalea sp.]